MSPQQHCTFPDLSVNYTLYRPICPKCTHTCCPVLSICSLDLDKEQPAQLIPRHRRRQHACKMLADANSQTQLTGQTGCEGKGGGVGKQQPLVTLQPTKRAYMPAALPAFTPLGASSNTKQVLGSAAGSNCLAACKKMSGAGLPCSIMSPAQADSIIACYF